MWQPNLPPLDQHQLSEAMKKLPWWQRELLTPLKMGYQGHHPEFTMFTLKQDPHLEAQAAFRDTLETRFKWTTRHAVWGGLLLVALPLTLYHMIQDHVSARCFEVFEELCVSSSIPTSFSS